MTGEAGSKIPLSTADVEIETRGKPEPPEPADLDPPRPRQTKDDDVEARVDYDSLADRKNAMAVRPFRAA